jgi:hypothetical protein
VTVSTVARQVKPDTGHRSGSAKHALCTLGSRAFFQKGLVAHQRRSTSQSFGHRDTTIATVLKD